MEGPTAARSWIFLLPCWKSSTFMKVPSVWKTERGMNIMENTAGFFGTISLQIFFVFRLVPLNFHANLRLTDWLLLRTFHFSNNRQKTVKLWTLILAFERIVKNPARNSKNCTMLVSSASRPVDKEIVRPGSLN